MNLLHLEYFRSVAQSENIQKSGKQLHVSPSAISAGIRSLEQELGVNLFDRVGRNVKLNTWGKQFLPFVNTAFEALQAGREALQHASAHQTVSFSVQDGALWSNSIAAFSKQHPEIQLRQLNCDPDPKGQLLFQANLDFAITDLELANSALECCALFEDSFVAAVTKDHPLSSLSNTLSSLFDLQDELFLFRPKKDIFQQYVDQIFKEIGFHPQRTMETEYILRYRVFRQERGILITTKRVLDSELADIAVCLPIQEFQGRCITKKLYWKKNISLSSSAQLFQKHLLSAYPTPGK